MRVSVGTKLEQRIDGLSVSGQCTMAESFTRAHSGQFLRATCCCREMYFNAMSTRQKTRTLVSTSHSGGRSSSPSLSVADAGLPLPHPMVLRAPNAGKGQRRRRGRAEDQAHPHPPPLPGGCGPGWPAHFFCFDCEQKTKSKMSKIK